MLQTILNSFTVAEIRKKLIFTAGILALYRLGAYIPAPVPTVQFPTPPVAFTVMRRAAELCRTTAASCCSSSASDGPVGVVTLKNCG